MDEVGKSSRSGISPRKIVAREKAHAREWD